MQWLQKNQVLNVLLGESSHVELLRRSSPLFRFLFRNKELNLQKAEEICDLAIEKHDTFRKHILNIIGDLVELMQIDELQHLFQKIKNLQNQEMDLDILQLIKAIGTHTNLSNKKSNDEENKKDRDSDKVKINT